MYRLVMLAAVVVCSSASAQGLVSGTVKVIQTYGNDSIPDVSDRLQLASLAKHKSVQRELQFTQLQIELFDEFMTESGGSFSTVIQQAAPGGAGKQLELELAKREQMLDELMIPTQWSRLRQLAYQIEIARVGLTDALTVGRLGRDVGVVENQKTHLREKLWSIEAAKLEALNKVKADEQAAFLALLQPEVKAKIEVVLGRPFCFREDTPAERSYNMRLMRKCSFNVSYGVLPEPQDEVGLCSLLLNGSVRREGFFREFSGNLRASFGAYRSKIGCVGGSS